jgi:thiosulfate reductase cytochrome b subunit
MAAVPAPEASPVETPAIQVGTARIVKKHPLAIRWFHWINFPVIAIMVWSGLVIYWANDVYKISSPSGKEIFHFFPDWFYAPVVHGLSVHAATGAEQPLYKLNFRLADGMAWHFLFFWVFTLNGLLYVGYLLFSKQWRQLVPDRKSWAESIQVVLHDLHIRKKPLPRRKYNAAQKIAYTSVVLIGLIMLLTGFAIYKPVQLGFLLPLMGGYDMAREIHFIGTLLLVAFFFVHVAQVIKTGWNNFRGMITGNEVVKADPEVADA